jgi:hypothetical protein
MIYNNVDLGNYGLTIAKSKWNFNVPFRTNIKEGLRGSGVILRNGPSSRRFNLNCIVKGNSEEDLLDKLTVIANTLEVEEDKYFYFDWFRSDVRFIGRYTGGLDDVEFLNPSTISFLMEMICVDPWAYSLNDTTQIVSIDSTSKPLPFTKHQICLVT